jgi:hypothetical protein
MKIYFIVVLVIFLIALLYLFVSAGLSDKKGFRKNGRIVLRYNMQIKALLVGMPIIAFVFILNLIMVTNNEGTYVLSDVVIFISLFVFLVGAASYFFLETRNFVAIIFKQGILSRNIFGKITKIYWKDIEEIDFDMTWKVYKIKSTSGAKISISHLVNGEKELLELIG